MINRGMLRFSFPLISLALAFGNTLGDLLRLHETVIKKPLGMYATGGGKGIQTLSPDEINGYYRVNLELQAKDPTLTENRKMTGLKLWQSQAIDFDEFQQKYLANANSTEMRRKLIRDKIMNHPMVADSLAQKLLQVVGAPPPINQNGGNGKTPQNPMATTPEMEIGQIMARGDLPNGQAIAGQDLSPERVSERLDAGYKNPLNKLPDAGL